MDRNTILDISQTIPGTGGRLDYAKNLFSVVNRLPKNCTILEIGTQSGGSATLFALAVKERGGRVHCIDPCFVRKDERPHEYSKYTGIGGYTRDYLSETLKKHDIYDIVTLHAGTSEEILNKLDKNILFDMIYVDGCHEYEAVKIDLKWLERTKDNAIAMFDDWIKPVKQAVDEYMVEHKNWKNQTDGSFFPVWFKKQ